MLVWLVIICFSVMTGYLCARYISGRKSVYFAAAIPWFSLLLALVYSVYFMPYKGGGASMWPIAQLFGGTVAAVLGFMSCQFFQNRRNNSPVKHPNDR